MGENLRRFYEENYAQLRLDGKTHEEAMQALDDAVRAAKLYDARSSAKTIMGDKYWPRIDAYQERIRNMMKVTGREELECGIQMADALAKAGLGMDSILALAACVEMIEPSERVSVTEQEKT